MKPVFQLKDMVFYVGNEEDMHGFVTGVLYTPGGIEYRIGWSDGTTAWHYDFELTKDKQFR